jgi:hypothetical protein
MFTFEANQTCTKTTRYNIPPQRLSYAAEFKGDSASSRAIDPSRLAATSEDPKSRAVQNMGTWQNPVPSSRIEDTVWLSLALESYSLRKKQGIGWMRLELYWCKDTSEIGEDGYISSSQHLEDETLAISDWARALWLRYQKYGTHPDILNRQVTRQLCLKQILQCPRLHVPVPVHFPRVSEFQTSCFHDRRPMEALRRGAST